MEAVVAGICRSSDERRGADPDSYIQPLSTFLPNIRGEARPVRERCASAGSASHLMPGFGFGDGRESQIRGTLSRCCFRQHLPCTWLSPITAQLDHALISTTDPVALQRRAQSCDSPPFCRVEVQADDASIPPTLVISMNAIRARSRMRSSGCGLRQVPARARSQPQSSRSDLPESGRARRPPAERAHQYARTTVARRDAPAREIRNHDRNLGHDLVRKQIPLCGTQLFVAGHGRQGTSARHRHRRQDAASPPRMNSRNREWP